MPGKLPNFNLNGKVAIVTGGAGLLGRQFSLTLAAAGAAVLVVDMNEAVAQKVANEISQARNTGEAKKADISQPDQVESMLQCALKHFERVDILVNSAAINPQMKSSGQLQLSSSGAFEDYPLEAWQQSLNINLTGAFLCSQAVIRQMLAQDEPGGVLINLCSTYGLGGPDQRIYQREGKQAQFKPVDYTVTKAGILGLTKYLATHYGERGIRANALTPGGVFNDQDEEFLQAYSARTVLGRMAREDEMNGALLFLASDASSYMTGANLVVDGGWTAW